MTNVDTRKDRRIKGRDSEGRAAGRCSKAIMGRMRLSLAVALVGAVAVSTGCTATPGTGTTCPTTLDQIGCSATFDLQRQQPNVCGASCCGVGGTCGAYQVWHTMPGSGGLICIYDATGLTLLSGTMCTDVLAYCAGTQFCETAGATIDPSSSCDLEALPSACNDGGVDGAPPSIDAAAPPVDAAPPDADDDAGV